MYDYTNTTDKPEPKKYLQVYYLHFMKFVKSKYGEHERENVFEMFANHHCDVFRNDSMFVFEQFFGCVEDPTRSIWTPGEDDEIRTRAHRYLREYLEQNGFNAYSTVQEYIDSECDCIIPGYDGILMNVTW